MQRFARQFIRLFPVFCLAAVVSVAAVPAVSYGADGADGTVTNLATHAAVQGVTVSIVGSPTTTTTAANGTFSISGAEGGTVSKAAVRMAVLRFSKSGYNTREISVRLDAATGLSVRLSASGSATFGPWENVNPAGAPARFGTGNQPAQNFGEGYIEVDPRNPGTVYLGTAHQGLWKTTNSGTAWTRVDGGVLDGRQWSIAADPFSTAIYSADGFGSNRGLFRSMDGNGTWVNIFPTSPPVPNWEFQDIYHIAVDPYKAGHIIATRHTELSPNGTGVSESNDNGLTWTHGLAQSGWGTANYCFFLNNSDSWLLVTQNPDAGSFKTSDGGATWKKVLAASVIHGGTQLYHSPVTGAFYVALSQGVYKSIDNGDTWTNVLPAIGQTPWHNDGYMAVVGDGEFLYTHLARLPSNNGGTSTITGKYPFMYASEATGTDWKPYNGQTFDNGPAQLSYDPNTGYLHAAMWELGAWRAKIR